MNVRTLLVPIFVIVLLVSAVGRALAAEGDDELCPPLDPPMGNIVEAATMSELQNAVNGAASGDTILVTDGVMASIGVLMCRT